MRFTIINETKTKAKGAWKYITTLRLTLNIETQIYKNCYKNIHSLFTSCILKKLLKNLLLVNNLQTLIVERRHGESDLHFTKEAHKKYSLEFIVWSLNTP